MSSENIANNPTTSDVMKKDIENQSTPSGVTLKNCADFPGMGAYVNHIYRQKHSFCKIYLVFSKANLNLRFDNRPYLARITHNSIGQVEKEQRTQHKPSDLISLVSFIFS